MGIFLLPAGGGSRPVSTYIVVNGYTNGPDFEAAGHSTARVTVSVTEADGATPVADGTVVTWAVTRAQNNSPAMYSGWGAKKTGLAWGAAAGMVTSDNIPELAASATSTTGNGLAAIQLTDIVGERIIAITASVTVDGALRGITQAVSFGKGPLFLFKAPDGTGRSWEQAYRLCNSSAPGGRDAVATWTTVDNGQYRGGGKLPTVVEYQAVAPVDTRWRQYANPNGNAHGAAYAAGWPGVGYWTGEAAFDILLAYHVRLNDGGPNGYYVEDSHHVACRR